MYFNVVLLLNYIFRFNSRIIRMGRAKKTKKFATMKRMISLSDPRLKDKERAQPKKAPKKAEQEIATT